MISIYTHKLRSIAQTLHITPETLLKYIYEELAFPALIQFEKDGMLRRMSQELTANNEGIFYILLVQARAPHKRPQLSDDYIGNLTQGAHHGAEALGYSILHRATNIAFADEDYFEKILSKYATASIIYLSPHHTTSIKRVCERLHRPLLIMDGFDGATLVPYYTLNINNRHAQYQITRHLLQQGHRQIAYIAGNLAHTPGYERLLGYQDALTEAGITVNRALIKEGDWQCDKARQLTGELLAGATPFTAIVCANDMSAMGVYNALRDAGLAIPQAMSVTGFDDLPVAIACEPTLTTMRQPLIEMGKRAAQILIAVTQGNPLEQRHFFQNVELVKRGSVAPPTAPC